MSRSARVRLDIQTREGEEGLERVSRAARGARDEFGRFIPRVREVETGLQRVGEDATFASDALRRTGRVSTRAARLIGQVGSAGGALSGTLTTLVPQLGGTAMVLGEAANAAEMFAGAGGAVLRVLGPIAAAALAAGAAYAYFSGQLKEAEEQQRKAAEGTATMIEMTRQLKETQLQAALAKGDITEEEFNTQMSASTAAQFFQARVEGLQAERQEIEKSIQALKEKAALEDARTQEITPGSFGRESSPAAQQAALDVAAAAKSAAANQLNRELAGLETRLAAVDTALANTSTAQEKYANNLLTIANSGGAAAGVAQKHASALAKEAAEAHRTADELAKVAKLRALLAGESVDKIVEMAMAQTTYDPDRAAREATARQQAGGLPFADGGVPIQAAGSALTQSYDLSTLTGGFGAITQGSLAGIAGAAGGPAGAALAASISGLQTLGEKGAQGVVEELRAQTDQLVAGLHQLPDLMTSLAEEAPEIAEAIAQAIVDVAPQLARAFFAEFNPLNRALKPLESVTDKLGLEGISGKIGGLRSGLRDLILGRNHSGLETSDDEVARVLQVGEVVTARGDMMPQSARVHGATGGAGPSGGGVTVNHYGPVLSDPLSSWHRGMDQRYGDNGWDRRPNYTGGVL